MFKCPKCGNGLDEFQCIKCGFVVKCIEGIYLFWDEDNIKIDDENKYIGYDEINIDFDPSIIYKGEDFYGIYGACAEGISKKFGKDITVLDLGCGLGSACIPLARNGIKTIGVDISYEMLKFTKRRSKDLNNNLYLFKMNAYNLLLEDESIDIVVDNAMIHLVDNPELVYKEIHRVLKKDGLLIRYGSKSISISEEEKELNKKSKLILDDISSFYYKTLEECGFKPIVFNNNSYEIENKYFVNENNKIELDYEEEFNDFLKYRIHRLEHKAHSDLQNIPDNIHQEIWNKTNEYAISKYGKDYKGINSAFKYKAIFSYKRKIV